MTVKFHIEVVRLTATSKFQLGELYINSAFVSHTLELPWKDNEPFVSSIPEGKYGGIIRYDSRVKNWVIEFTGTKPRENILFHTGARPDNTEGCILLGTSAYYSTGRLSDNKPNEAYERLKTVFYGASDPVASPNVEIEIVVSFSPVPLRFFPESETGPYYYFEGAQWFLRGDGVPSGVIFDEIVRTATRILLKPRSGQFSGQYVRWPLLGNGPYQVSRDLKMWGNVTDLPMRRLPLFGLRSQGPWGPNVNRALLSLQVLGFRNTRHAPRKSILYDIGPDGSMDFDDHGHHDFDGWGEESWPDDLTDNIEVGYEETEPIEVTGNPDSYDEEDDMSGAASGADQDGRGYNDDQGRDDDRDGGLGDGGGHGE